MTLLDLLISQMMVMYYASPSCIEGEPGIVQASVVGNKIIARVWVDDASQAAPRPRKVTGKCRPNPDTRIEMRASHKRSFVNRPATSARGRMQQYALRINHMRASRDPPRRGVTSLD